MKKLWIALPVLAIAAIAFYSYKSKKVPTQALLERRQTIEDQSAKRMPASLPDSTKNKVNALPSKKREFIGDKKLVMKNGKIRYTNKPSKNWLSKLQSSLNRGTPKDTTIDIKPERSLVMLEGTLGKNTEQVVVVFNSKNNRNSYRAMVDSQTGKIFFPERV